MPTCPFCAKDVADWNKSCPHCRKELPAASVTRPDGLPSHAQTPASNRSNVALVTVGVVMVTLVCSGVLVGLFVPAMLHVRESSHETKCMNNLKQIGSALHNYHDRWQSFPPAYTVDSQGRRLHSWRVLILPFLGQQTLYDSIDLSQPWDSPRNVPLLAKMPPEFGCPSDAAPGATSTNYVAVVGDKCVFRGEKPVSIHEITDGTSNTILLGEVIGANIPWMKPDDLNLSSFAGFSSKHSNSVHFLMTDGSARSMPGNPASPWPGQFTRDGND